MTKRDPAEGKKEAAVLQLPKPPSADEEGGLTEERARELRQWVEEGRSHLPSSVIELAHRLLESGDIDD
jgi:hypothetical protein